MKLYAWCSRRGGDGEWKPMTLEWDGSNNRPVAMAFRTEDEARRYTAVALAAGEVCGWDVALQEFTAPEPASPFTA